MFWIAAGISGRRRDVEVLEMVDAAEREGEEKLRRVCKGYDKTERSSRADSDKEPVIERWVAADSGRCQKWQKWPVASSTILVWSGKLNYYHVSYT